MADLAQQGGFDESLLSESQEPGDGPSAVHSAALESKGGTSEGDYGDGVVTFSEMTLVHPAETEFKLSTSDPVAIHVETSCHVISSQPGNECTPNDVSTNNESPGPNEPEELVVTTELHGRVEPTVPAVAECGSASDECDGDDRNSDDQPNTTVMLAPAMEETTVGVEVVTTPLSSTPKTEPHGDQPHDIYHIKWIRFNGRRTPIVTQNINGPCPLLAITNILLLRGKISLPSAAEVVTSSQLMTYLGDLVLLAAPEGLDNENAANYEQNVNDAIAVFHKLQTGLDVNVRFTSATDFEFTPECVVFDLLDISLYHGWLVDPSDPDQAAAIGSATYNQLVEMIISNKTSDDLDKVKNALIAEEFLNASASQLTYHGLSELSTALAEEQLCVFFRNNHFSTLYKYKGELFLLVTDQGYLRETRVVWETLSNVEGDGHLVDSEFHSLGASHTQGSQIEPPPMQIGSQQQLDHDLLLALSLTEDESSTNPALATADETDEELALRLQEEENMTAAAEASREEINQQQLRQAASESEAANASATRPKKSSCTLL